jgi:cyclic pyranopterin phosphate synthase
MYDRPDAMTPFDAPFAPSGARLSEPPRLADASPVATPRLSDPFGRTIDYLRVSVTDRCDLRCIYCMPEKMRFLPRPEVLTIEELDRLCSAFVTLGTKKLRLTGGEPLVRRGVMALVERLSRHLRSGDLSELTLTTNGTQLAQHAAELARLGVRRINVSLDSLNPATFARLTRGGDLNQVLAGLQAAKAVGLKVKLNTVVLARENRSEIPAMLQFAHSQGFDLTLIETMPMGEIDQDRTDQFVSLAEVKSELASIWTLNPVAHATGGPARYFRVEETGGLLGLITPMSEHFCATCNRVRVTCTGTLHTCLGHDDAIDLRAPLRDHPGDAAPLIAAIRQGIANKPERHDFRIGAGEAPTVARHMSTTGG